MPLSDLVGNAEARSALVRALALGRLPHAILLHGPRGIGKKATAIALAQALLCPAASPDACGTCNTCRRVNEGLHPDLLLVERDGQFVKIDTVRELVRESFLKPYEGRAKVILMPEAERLNDDAANALLKTLEEPPPGTYLVLVTSSREAVLPTIRSRCQAVELHPLSRAELATLLVLRHALPADEADLRARLGDGSEETALALDLPAYRTMRAEVLALVQALAGGKLTPREADALTRLAEEGAKSPDAIELLLLRVLRSVARDALVRASGGGSELLANADVPGPLAELAMALGASGATALLADLEEAEAELRQNANKKLLAEAVLAGIYARAVKARPRAGPTPSASRAPAR